LRSPCLPAGRETGFEKGPWLSDNPMRTTFIQATRAQFGQS
jgi:hypothetical protein